MPSRVKQPRPKTLSPARLAGGAVEHPKSGAGRRKAITPTTDVLKLPAVLTSNTVAFNVYQRRLSPHNGMRQLLDRSQFLGRCSREQPYGARPPSAQPK